ncbi:MAG: CBS domain-containing protein [Deltaproteobacteria bacterium]|nr:CBS domain-containing protein [Deltaproteobacteria bacterium]
MFPAISDVKARDLMRQEMIALRENQTVADAVVQMDKLNRGSVVVLDKSGGLAGIFTERDLVRRVVAKGKDPKKTPLAEVITTKVVQAQDKDEAIKLLELMCEHHFRHIPIFQDKKLVGMVSLKQFFKFFLEKQKSYAA